MRADKGDKKAARLLATIDEPHSFFATTQLYYTFIAFFSGAYAANSFTEPLANLTLGLGLPVSADVVETAAFVIVTAVLTYVTLIIGELVPKRIAMRYAIPYSLRILPVLNVLSILAVPFVKALSASAKLLLNLLGIMGDNPEDVITKEEISMMVESSSEHGHIPEIEQDMIENIFTIDTLTAGDICTHRLDVVALPLDADRKTVLDMLAGEYYTRMPIYIDSLDNVFGILYTKDVLRYMATTPDLSGFDIKTLMREVHFVSLSKKIDELFQEMRKDRSNMVVVIDEYGGTMGIVTIEDLVEIIVGNIQDEYDTHELPDIVAIGEHSFRIQGITDLETVQDHFDVSLPIGDYDTLNGFLVGQLGYIPLEGEKPEVTFNGLIFKVETLKEKRIETVIVKKGGE
jgi:putative hemolysin